MGHIVGKDVYRDLGNKIDSLNVKVPWNETWHAILKELYSETEADIVSRMPSGLATLPELTKLFQFPESKLRKILETLCNKGLVVDLFMNDRFYYVPSPLVIGIFEFTMMRTDKDLDIKKISRLFSHYMNDETFYRVNFGPDKGTQLGIMRTLPYEESVNNHINPGDAEFVEVLDYEKATEIIEQGELFSIGACSCRHEKLHTGEKTCETPINTCTSIGYSADYLIRNNLAKKASKSEMLELIARSKEMGLILNADNVRNRQQFICHCCKCCCHVLQGVTKFGFPDIIVTSTLIVEADNRKCVGCGLCVKACGVEAITEIEANNKKDRGVVIDESLCLGCGVCVTKCKTGALTMVKRKQRVLHPETTFEKAILKNLESGTLQDQLFTNPKSISQKALRAILGGFLRLSPVKRALMGDTMRSSFLKVLKKGANLQGKGWLTEL
jgi:Pyruvate/2-oxoacid:ferredoxin oxidoreductase delta subunit